MKCLSLLLLSLVLAAPSAEKPEDAAAADKALDERVTKLIGQLGDQQFAVRQRAQQELTALGFEAFDLLSEAEQSDDPEIAMQAGYLVRLIRSEWSREGDPREVQEILKDYEAQADDRRLLKIRQLAELPDGKGLEWLCRLVRFERSPALAKLAALAIMKQPAPADDAAWQKRVETINTTLRRGRRPAAKWLTVYIQSHSDPAGALARWSELTEAERQTFEQHPQETSGAVVSELLRRKIDLLDRLGRSDETTEVMRQMVLCERGDSNSLMELIDWLVKRKAWSVVDEVAKRFEASFEVDAVLMYTLCEARLAQGDQKLAEETAQRALKISGDSQQEHGFLARRLMDRGLVHWAEREWRYVIELGPLGTQWDVIARDYLANSLHDRQLDAEAAAVLQQLVDAADNDVNVLQRLRTTQQQVDTNPNAVRANMHFYQACHAASQGDRAKQRELLEKGLQRDSSNVEILIALYQLTDDEPEKRGEIMKLIRNVIEVCRTRIDDMPDEPTYYNQIAWLIANTEGDFDEALRLSHKSVELARVTSDSPRRLGGLLDTLGHCYFAKKDYANAVKYQSEAAELDPHTQTIGRQLKKFREALAAAEAESKPAPATGEN